MLVETCPNSGYYFVVDPENNPHLGGNIKGGDPWCRSPELWDYLINKYKIKSLLDVGSADGTAAKYFMDKEYQKYNTYNSNSKRKPSLKTIKKIALKNSHQIKCIETGEIFSSFKEAASKINVKSSAITQAIKKNYRCGGYHWEKVK